jgi:hypothetical protein
VPRRSSILDAEVLQHGYLDKASSGAFRQHQSRYFVAAGHYLKYYESSERCGSDDGVKGCLDLRDVLSVEADGKTLTIVCGGGGGKALELVARSSENAAVWKEAIEAGREADTDNSQQCRAITGTLRRRCAKKTTGASGDCTSHRKLAPTAAAAPSSKERAMGGDKRALQRVSFAAPDILPILGVDQLPVTHNLHEMAKAQMQEKALKPASVDCEKKPNRPTQKFSPWKKKVLEVYPGSIRYSDPEEGVSTSAHYGASEEETYAMGMYKQQQLDSSWTITVVYKVGAESATPEEYEKFAAAAADTPFSEECAVTITLTKDSRALVFKGPLFNVYCVVSYVHFSFFDVLHSYC